MKGKLVTANSLHALGVLARALGVLSEAFKIDLRTESYFSGQFVIVVLQSGVPLQLAGQVLIQDLSRLRHDAV